MAPNRDSSALSEVLLHESVHARVTRLFLPGRTVVRKELLGPDTDRRLRHERAMLSRLRDVAGVVQELVDEPEYPGSILLADLGGATLTGRKGPLGVDELIEIALGVARAVAGAHQRGVIHRDISPAGIVVSADGTPHLVDFGLATSFAELRPEFTHHTEIVGTLPYLAPEQTGRTGRPVDQRADLYALGATLYDLAAGRPPFGSGDPLRLTHDHLARRPVPPAEVNPAVPAAFSEIVMRLLEKEPDHRYQTAEGVVYDLERVRDAQEDPASADIRIGEHDVPLRLLPPSRLVGRDAEVAALHAALEAAIAGQCQGLLVSGIPGVGKTALLDQLRSAVTSRGGWFVAGKSDQYRRDLEFNAIFQAFHALGRLLLAEPEDELAEFRARALTELGPNAALLSAAVPIWETVLDVQPDPGDPLTALERANLAGIQALRAVGSRERPVVMFLDDLQWSGRSPLGVADHVLTSEPIEGLLLVGAYREAEVDAAPLGTLLPRWRDQAGVRQLRLDNLTVAGLVAMVGEILHVPRDVAAGLVAMIEPRTAGNPHETVELLNTLNREGVLTATAAGWQWDDAAVRARLGESEVVGLLASRITAMPPASRALVEAMACLGGRAELSLLQTATDTPAGVVDQRLAAALEEGVLVVEPGLREAVRFRHDQIREVILRGLDSDRERALHLDMARRLSGVPDLYAVAAEQYLPVIDAVTDAAERRRVVGLLRRAADEAAVIGEYALVNTLLVGALPLVAPDDSATLLEVHTVRHIALYSLGRLDEADEAYRVLERLCDGTIHRAASTTLQVRSLTHRNRFAEAIDLGLESLNECGIAMPAAHLLGAELERQFDHLYQWLDADLADELTRPEITDPTLLTAIHLLDAVLPAGYFAADHAMEAWASLEALRIWIEHGPAPSLVSPACVAFFHAVTQRGDRAAGYRALQRILEIGEARGYESETAHVRRVLAILSCWFEPIENGVHANRRAREGLIVGGDLAYAGYTYHPTVYFLLDCAPTLDSVIAAVEEGLAFVGRMGSEQTGQMLDSHRALADLLRGEGADAIGSAVPTDRYADNPLALFHAHLNRAIAAVVCGHPADLARHTAAAMPLLPAVLGNYPTAVAHLLHGLAVAEQARNSHGNERDAALSALDEVTRWLAARAADAPDNFLHLQRLIEAERAWAVGDFHAAVLAFDSARREVGRRQRPWHRAVIAEHSARFYLDHGVEQAGFDLLAQARQEYLVWGASAKVAQLDWAYPMLRRHPEATAGKPGDTSPEFATVTTGTLDLLGILSASQALSSETSIERLHDRVAQVLGAMTGATGVHLLLWSDEHDDWLLSAPDGATPVGDTGHDRAVPLSVVRYVQRLAEPLVVADATRDDRFARDPYLKDLDRCSLLAVPILGRGVLRAQLLMENRLIRGAFTTDRLDAVTLIAGQLAVSLDNAQLYAELTTSRARIVAAGDQTRRRIERDLHDGAQQRLVTLALQARVARAAVPSGSDELAAQLDILAAEAASALAELRELARGIHPVALTEGGLRPALKALTRRSMIPVRLTVRVERRLPEQIEIATYYLVAEALTNATRHSRASTLTVAVETDPGHAVLQVSVSDDGLGGADLARGSGLVGLKDRVEALGGLLAVQSAPGAGTTVHAELPLGPARAAIG